MTKNEYKKLILKYVKEQLEKLSYKELKELASKNSL